MRGPTNAPWISFPPQQSFASAMQRAGLSGSLGPAKKDRLKPVALDPLEAIGLPSKGDNRLLDLSAQEDYFQKLLDRVKDHGSRHDTNDLEASLGSLSLNNHNARKDGNGKIPTLAAVDLRDVSIVTAAMRKLREAIVASSRTDDFALRVYIFIVLETILLGHVESYHPALLHLMRKLLPMAHWPKSEVQRFFGYYILDLACRQADLGAAFEARHGCGLQDEGVNHLLKAMACGNWVLYWNAQRQMDVYQQRLAQMSDDRMRNHTLGCIGVTYLSVDKEYAERAAQQPWTSGIERSQPGWQLEGNTLIIRRIKKK